MKLHVKRASFSTDNSRTSRNFPFFTLFLTTKSLSQTFSITLLQISCKLHEHWGDYWRKKLLWMILEEQFPLPRNNSVSKIGNSAISLLWQLRCHCNPDYNKFSSLSNTTVVAIFPKLCLWRRSLCSNLGGIGPEKLYRATLSNLLLLISFFTSSKVKLVNIRSEDIVDGSPKLTLGLIWTIILYYQVSCSLFSGFSRQFKEDEGKFNWLSIG